MACADVIITKPGGLSISEALARGLIPVFISVIPGQEAGNVRVLQDAGIGLLPKDSNEAVKTVLRLKDKPADFSYMKDNIRRFRKTSALKELMDVIRAGSAEPGC
jgi:processive 1,2-diacylglycerol beta-glucosyltransferase